MISLRSAYANIYDTDIRLFVNIAESLETPDGISREFGLYITDQDIRIHIPTIGYYQTAAFNYVQNLLDDLDEEFVLEDVVHKQKLNVVCSYVNDLGKDVEECTICYSDIKCDTMLNCGHTYCIDCVTTNTQLVIDDHRKKLTCPICRAETNKISSIDDIKIDNLAELLK